jgi:iron complex outermembrane receptor protein
MTYAQFSTGYKGGGVNPRPFNPAQAQPFGPETVGAYEIGIKTDLFDRTVRFNVSAFHNDYSDIQLTLLSCPQFGGPGPCALPANAGNADIDGIEFELAIRPAEGLLIDASLSYVDFDYTFVNPAAGTPGGPGVQLNHVPPYLAEWQWAIGIQYEIPLGDNVGSLTPRLDLSHRSSVFSNAVNAPTNFIGGYELANGRLTYRSPDEDWDVSLEVTNLFDTYYLQSSFDLSGVSGFTSAVPARPREWALTVTRRF